MDYRQWLVAFAFGLLSGIILGIGTETFLEMLIEALLDAVECIKSIICRYFKKTRK